MNEVTVAFIETRHLDIFPSNTLLAPDKEGLEVCKKVQYVSVTQWAAKLQLVKLGVIFHKV